ncbi:MAG: hypothetical protein CL581_09525 [Alteromonadaceae bacterium]|jgi:hypothetical protein|nr:hypothetical protein [Alteromonadaceae bacterium]|tara:strand:+ start:963 stop:1160 length:198 start_codon:yes stop_codon:yes gene_type:complete
MMKCKFVHTDNQRLHNFFPDTVISVRFICTTCGSTRFKRLTNCTKEDIAHAANTPMVNIDCEVSE